jgi:WD40 repeat protein
MPSVSCMKDIPTLSILLHADILTMSIPSHFHSMDLVLFLADGTTPFISGIKRQVVPSVSGLGGHSSYVNSITCSPNGSHIMSGSLIKTNHLWDPEISDIASTLSCTGYCQLLLSGWVVNLGAEKLFWVPPWQRAGLCFPTNTMAIS